MCKGIVVLEICYGIIIVASELTVLCRVGTVLAVVINSWTMQPAHNCPSVPMQRRHQTQIASPNREMGTCRDLHATYRVIRVNWFIVNRSGENIAVGHIST